MTIQHEDKRFGFLFNNEWKQSESGRTIEIYSPDDEQMVGQVQAMTQNEVNEAIASVKEAQAHWENKNVHERVNLLHRWADELEKRADEIGETIQHEVGKAFSSARGEVIRTAELIRHTAEDGLRVNGELMQGDGFPGGDKEQLAMIKKVPHGVVLAISPFNYPVNLAAAKIAPALIAGNGVVFKPATQGAVSGMQMVEALVNAGLPEGVLNVVTGRGSEIGDFVVQHPTIDLISFTGGTETGQRISEKATMAGVILELGGKDPAIVLSDGDLDKAAKEIVGGAFSYSGQRCTAIKRVLVMEDVADQLVEKVQEKVEALKVGKASENAQITPMINDGAADYVEELIADAKDKGAKVVTTGERQGNLLHPTLLDNVTTDMRIAWEEQFGPVLPIIRISNPLEAIELENENEYGLQGSIFTKNIDDAMMLANKLEVGTVQINGKTSRGPDHYPFLGVKNSGQGVQGIGRSISSMLRDKVIVMNM
ncbi:NADP-dependent glyceraldehyde-3-phosphate dehydrogenase [Texcoconibacillus texcoconensis]|uniref:Glyceraldehyde-3-phosphate dehydrogenase (NADP+) n=1 Tax=Texcoconibacillus texcoconensis TaxID=1095777 RepID=A0A840QNF1_9BACI|nr:NADP-dependent glyceraldehyde-3-phosphate dehydrogenase [Texcoconibacillus texcoconensis]MBB5172863.1 glyceraldehyde-3-phosphate dehydrogenase (NADP+) [Texcoconibacillus texcoconensis]